MDTSTPHQAAPDPTPQAPAVAQSNSFFAGVRRLGITRGDDRWIAGVSSGVADRFGLDPLLVRGILAASVLLAGFGLVVYGVAWALLPERQDGRIHLEEMILGRFDIALLGALAFVLVGLGRGDGWFFFWAPPGWIQGLLWLLFAGALVVATIVFVNRHPSAPLPPRAYPQPYSPPAPMPAPGLQYGPPTPQYGPPTPQYGPPAPLYGQPVPAPQYGRPAPATDYARPAPTYAATAPAHAPSYASASTAPYGTPGPTPAPVRASRPPRPPRQRTPGAGAGTVGVVVALSLLTLAVLLVAERISRFDGPVFLTTLGVSVVLCGLGIIVSGLRGRTSGGLGGLAILALIVALPLAAVTSATALWSGDGVRQFSAQDVAFTDRTTAAAGYTMGVGDATVDLTGIPLTSHTLEVPISLAAGNLTVVVPADATIEAVVTLGAGQVTWDVNGVQQSQSGVDVKNGTFTTGGFGVSGPQLRLVVGVGAGQVTISDHASSPTSLPRLTPLPTLPGLPGEEIR